MAAPAAGRSGAVPRASAPCSSLWRLAGSRGCAALNQPLVGGASWRFSAFPPAPLHFSQPRLSCGFAPRFSIRASMRANSPPVPAGETVGELSDVGSLPYRRNTGSSGTISQAEPARPTWAPPIRSFFIDPRLCATVPSDVPRRHALALRSHPSPPSGWAEDFQLKAAGHGQHTLSRSDCLDAGACRRFALRVPAGRRARTPPGKACRFSRRSPGCQIVSGTPH